MPSTRSNNETSSPATTNMLNAIDRKLNDLRADIKKEIINEFKRHEERVMARLGEMSAQIANVRGGLQSLSSKYKLLKEGYEHISAENEELKVSISALENKAVASDVVIHNVPNTADINITMQKIIGSVDCAQLSVVKAFRTQVRAGVKCAPIIAKFKSADDRVTFFRALAAFKKSKNRQLQLDDVGLADNDSIGVYECLSAYNKHLFKTALLHKRNNLLNSVYTLRGQVFVRLEAAGKATKVRDVKALSDVVGGKVSK